MRILGRVLIAVGVLVSVGCGFVLAGLHSLSHYLDENPSPLSRGDAFTQALAQTALVVTPGILIALFGWALSRGPQEESERPARHWWSWAWVPVALAAWVGAAWYISSITETPEPPQTFATGRDLTPDELRAKDRRIRLRRLGVESQTAADRAAHHIPEARLRQAERTVEARLQRNYPGSTSDIDCVRTSGWRVSCGVNITYKDGDAPSSFEVPGRYVPRQRAVDFRPW